MKTGLQTQKGLIVVRPFGYMTGKSALYKQITHSIMKKVVLTVVALSLILIGSGIYFFKSQPKELPPEEFADALEADPSKVLVDLRPAGEFSKGHIPGATNIDCCGATYEWNIAELAPSSNVYLCCADGKRSAKTASYLESLGFDTVLILQGGIRQWEKKRFELTPEELVAPPDLTTLEQFSWMMDLEHLVIVDFYIRGDKKCLQIEPVLDAIAITYRNKLKLLRIEIDDYKQLASELGIKTVPTLHFYENGNLTGWSEGAIGRDRLEGELGLREYVSLTLKN